MRATTRSIPVAIFDLDRTLIPGSSLVPVAELRGAVFDAAEEIVRALRPGVHQLVHRHATAGDLCVLLSASPHELVQEVAGRPDLDIGIGTRVEVRDRVLTGRLDGPVCHGDGKLARLRDELPVDLARATAYSDAATDLPPTARVRLPGGRPARSHARGHRPPRGLAHRGRLRND